MISASDIHSNSFSFSNLQTEGRHTKTMKTMFLLNIPLELSLEELAVGEFSVSFLSASVYLFSFYLRKTFIFLFIFSFTGISMKLLIFLNFTDNV